MTPRMLLVGLAAAVLGVSATVAVAEGLPGNEAKLPVTEAAGPRDAKGKSPATEAGCKPSVSVVLKGSLTATPLSIDVASANRWGRAYVAGTSSAEIEVDGETKVRRQGKKMLTDLVVGDRVLVQAKVCTRDLAEGATPDLTASKVIAHPAKP